MDDRNMVIVAAKREYDDTVPAFKAITSREAFVNGSLRDKKLAPLTEQERRALGEEVVVARQR